MSPTTGAPPSSGAAAATIDHDNLEEFHDPANYDVEEAADAAPRARFYGELAAKLRAPVLEIACGTGLVAIPVASRGLAVTGADICRPMLEHARLQSARAGLAVRWIEADARSLVTGDTFGLVYLTGNAFQAFLRGADQRALLATVRRHLAPGGVFAFETRNPAGHDLSSHDDERPWRRYTSVEGHRLRVSGTQRYDPQQQLMHWTTWRRWHDGEADRVRVTRIACRFTGAGELAALLHDNGFRILRQHGDWDGTPFRPTSPAIISVCRAR